MIEQRLINVINSGRAWAFVGSGASVDAGLPTWQDLYIRVVRTLENTTPPQAPPPATLPNSFGQLITQHGRTQVLSQVANHLTTTTLPGPAHHMLASWPFAAYVTTNYDRLLDLAMLKYPSWVSVGNTPSETRKISGDVSNVVWHPHGIINAPADTSRIIISHDDYDDTYPAGSPTVEALRALIRMRSLVFVGFGFNDPDLAQLLELVARLSDPGQPAYAFLSDSTPARREELRTKYNVVTIPYDSSNGDHSELLAILRHHSHFVANRNIFFGGTPSAPPSYDPEVTSLIVQNALHSGTMEVPKATQERVMRASVLAALSAHESLTEPDLEHQVRSSPQALTHGTFQGSLDLLIRDRLVARSEDRLTLTPATAELISKRQASAQLLFDQFLASIRHRATANIDSVEPDVIAQRVSDIAATFFQAICKRRGLAIAQNLSGGPEGHLQRRAVALLQELPNWFSQCHSLFEIRALTNVVFGVLSDPQKSERVYLGFLTQAYFGKHIAGVDEESIALRRELLSQTVFVLDSHFIIVLLARGCTAHDHAAELVKMLTDANTVLIATDLILVETTEHIEWAIKQVTVTGQGTSLQKAFDVARGVAGQSNSFLLGYSECRARGECDSFGQYILAAIDQQHTQQPTSALVRTAVASYGILIDEVQELLQSSSTFRTASAGFDEQIKLRRQEYGSYKHDRQVAAEAQVVAFVSGIKSGEIRAVEATNPKAFFVTDSPILDGLEGCPQRICMTPEGLHQWLLSTKPLTPEAAGNVFDHLLLELMESGIQFVSTERIVKAFGPIVQAGREQLDKLASEHRVVIESCYGVDHQKILSRIDSLLVGDAVEFLSDRILREQASRLALEEAKRREAEKRLRALESLRDDVTRYQRRKREKQRRRAAQSRPKTRKQKQRERQKNLRK